MKEVLCWMMETQYKKVIYMADVLTKEQRHKNMKIFMERILKLKLSLEKLYGQKVIGTGRIIKSYQEIRILC